MTRPEAGVRVSDWHAEKKHREIFPRRLSDNYKHIGSGLTATRTAGGPGPVHEDEGRVLMGQPMSWQLEPVSCYIIRMSPPADPARLGGGIGTIRQLNRSTSSRRPVQVSLARRQAERHAMIKRRHGERQRLCGKGEELPRLHVQAKV